MVCVAVHLGHELLVVLRIEHLGCEVGADQREVRTHEVPVHAVGEPLVMEVDALGFEDTTARLDREVVHEVERLGLGSEPEHEVHDAAAPAPRPGHRRTLGRT